MTGKRALYRRKLCTKTPCSVLYLVGIYIKFLFIDEYELFHEKKKVFVEGHARIVRKEPGTQSLIIGCEVYGRREALEQYVADRKLIPFVKDEIRFLHDD